MSHQSAAVEVRPATTSDVGAVVRLDPLAADESGRQASIVAAVGGGRCAVALLGGRPAGYGVLDYTFFGNGFIALIYVAPDCRRRGVATALVRHLERACSTPKLFTSTNVSNEPMRRLLGGLGYAPSGVIENLDDGDPELVFFKRLRPSA